MDTHATVHLQFDDNALFAQLVGSHNAHLDLLEQLAGITVFSRGNQLTLSGPGEAVASAQLALEALYRRLQKGRSIARADLEAALRMSPLHAHQQPVATGVADFNDDSLTIRTRKKHISPRSLAQGRYIKALAEHDIVFGIGPAGTGKTYLAVAKGVELLLAGAVEKIILSRPAVEAGENLGFLPGDLKTKVDPYLRPLYDALYDTLPYEVVLKKMDAGEIEVAPLAFMRGRTLAHAYVILDEAQNATEVQMKMFLTRLGEGSRMAVTGDPSQVDLPRHTRSGLHQAMEVLQDVHGIGMVHFSEDDVVRHPLVGRIVKAYRRAGEEGI
jgi:phosphate starvation-inducible protein PhoH and related proteins